MQKSLKNGHALFVITHFEMEMLNGMPHFYQLLYFYLRSKMDKCTGLVGAKHGCRVSLGGLAEHLYVEPGQGLKNTGTPTIKQIRIAIGALQRKGLIELRSITSVAHKQLIIFLTMAQQGYSVQNKVGTFGAHKQDTEQSEQLPVEKIKKPISYPLNEYFSDAKQGKDEQSKEGTPQEYINNSLYTRERLFFIQNNFRPNEQCLVKIKELDLQSLHSPLELQKFISYNQSKQQECKDWDSKYLCWLINAKQYEEKREIKGVNKQSHHTRLSAVDRVKQRNQRLLQKPIIDLGTHF